jgi:hypothetical protein
MLRAPVSGPVGGPARHDAKAQETRQHFSESKERAIDLLQQAISTLEQEIANAEPVVVAPKKSTPAPIIEPDQDAKAPQAEVCTPSHRRWGGIGEAVQRRVGRWWRGRKG